MVLFYIMNDMNVVIVPFRLNNSYQDVSSITVWGGGGESISLVLASHGYLIIAFPRNT